MDWTPWKGTRAAAHLPPDAEDKCEECFFWQVYCIKWHNISPKVSCHHLHDYHINPDLSQLVVNFDQIGNHILPSNSCTFNDCGAEQVDIVVKDEKHAFTLLVASTADGDFLPFQQVWAGASVWSLLSQNAPWMQDALDRGFDFVFAKSNKKTSHFSTVKTMKEVNFSCDKSYVSYADTNYSRLRTSLFHGGSVLLSQTQISMITTWWLYTSIVILFMQEKSSNSMSQTHMHTSFFVLFLLIVISSWLHTCEPKLTLHWHS